MALLSTQVMANIADQVAAVFPHPASGVYRTEAIARDRRHRNMTGMKVFARNVSYLQVSIR